MISKPVINNGLTGFWNFDDSVSSAIVTDSSSYGNNGTKVNGASATTSNSGLGRAMSFNSASSQYVSIPTSAGIGNSNYTVAGWIYRASSGQSGAFIKIGGLSSGIGIGISAGGVSGFESAGDELTVLYEAVRWIPTGQNFGTGWHYFAVTVDASGYPSVYYDGLKVYTDTGTVSVAPASELIQIGGYHGDRYYTGIIDEVRIYNRALSADEIKKLYKVQKIRTASGVNNTGLVGYWPFDEGYGTKTRDTSFNSNDGALNGGPTWTVGKNGKAITFDGSDDYIDLVNDSAYGLLTATSEITLSAWIKTRALDAAIIGLRNGVSTSIIDFQIGNDGADNGGTGTPSFLVWGDDGNGLTHIHGSTPVNDGIWHHIVATRNSSKSMKIYVDGVVVATGTDTMTSAVTIADARIGDESANTGITNFNGQIDDVRIYNRALSATEVQSLYKGSSASVVGKSRIDRITNGLVGYWTFDGNKVYGTNAYDSSSSGNNGTLTNGPKVAIGKIGQGLIFDGSDDYVATSAFGSVPQSVSLSAWIYPTAGGVVFSECDAVACGTWHDSQMEVLSTGEIKVGYWNGASSNILPLGTFSLNAWHHVVLTYDTTGTIGKGYVDGVLRNSSGVAKAYPPTLYYAIGRSDSTNLGDGTYFNGKIDDVRVYNRAISADEVKALYNTGK